MKKKDINKKKVLKSVVKMVTDKETVRSYMQGKISMQKLTERGIKFANPL